MAELCRFERVLNNRAVRRNLLIPDEACRARNAGEIEEVVY